MIVLKRFALCSFLLLSAFLLPAQKITGTWEGYVTGEFIQINIEQKGNELCGYTYDYELNNKASHCIAAFEGRYDPERKMWYLSGKSFVENSGSHVFMRIILWNEKEDGKNILRGQVYTKPAVGSFPAAGDDLKVKRVSSKPQELGSILPPCFPPPIKPVVPKSNAVVKPLPSSPAVRNKPAEPKLTKPIPDKSFKVNADTPIRKMSSLDPVVQKSLDNTILRKMNARKKTEQSRLSVSVTKINLKVYDNGVVDNDTVSIFYNGKLLLSHQRLSETAIEINLELDPEISLHEITMYAENLGAIPPNTALIVVTAGDKRYELRSKSSLEENAVLVIEYKPRQID